MSLPSRVVDIQNVPFLKGSHFEALIIVPLIACIRQTDILAHRFIGETQGGLQVP
jgi:hypothetical protein